MDFVFTDLAALFCDFMAELWVLLGWRNRDCIVGNKKNLAAGPHLLRGSEQKTPRELRVSAWSGSAACLPPESRLLTGQWPAH
ncbi:hypothetical protein [Stenotrophomonas sp.]|uniref:hypothetical protein n=1 Tax=Stenotrophomonas sp. TaxID=69392 RepID=UPI0028A85740|nr:hypothetical protein [Stenotrophomonas sp.]